MWTRFGYRCGLAGCVLIVALAAGFSVTLPRVTQ